MHFLSIRTVSPQTLSMTQEEEKEHHFRFLEVCDFCNFTEVVNSLRYDVKVTTRPQR